MFYYTSCQVFYTFRGPPWNTEGAALHQRRRGIALRMGLLNAVVSSTQKHTPLLVCAAVAAHIAIEPGHRAFQRVNLIFAFEEPMAFARVHLGIDGLAGF